MDLTDSFLKLSVRSHFKILKGEATYSFRSHFELPNDTSETTMGIPILQLQETTNLM